MKKVLWILPLLLCFWAMPLPAHNIHISYGNGTLSETSLTLRLTFFKDDFNRAVQQWSEQTQPETAAVEPLENRFLRAHFSVTAGEGQPLPLSVTAGAEDGSSIWFKIECRWAAPTEQLRIQNTALFTAFSDQMNLLNVKTPQGELGFILTAAAPSASLSN